MSRGRGEQGSVTAFVAIVAVALVMVAGMAYDGGQIIAAHNAARNDAERAARAAAQQIDVDHLRTSAAIRLDPGAASDAALAYLDRVDARGVVEVDGATVTVTVTRTQPMHILPGSDRVITVAETVVAVDEEPA